MMYDDEQRKALTFAVTTMRMGCPCGSPFKVMLATCRVQDSDGRVVVTTGEHFLKCEADYRGFRWNKGALCRSLSVRAQTESGLTIQETWQVAGKP